MTREEVEAAHDRHHDTRRRPADEEYYEVHHTSMYLDFEANHHSQTPEPVPVPDRRSIPPEPRRKYPPRSRRPTQPYDDYDVEPAAPAPASGRRFSSSFTRPSVSVEGMFETPVADKGDDDLDHLKRRFESNRSATFPTSPGGYGAGPGPRSRRPSQVLHNRPPVSLPTELPIRSRGVSAGPQSRRASLVNPVGLSGLQAPPQGFGVRSDEDPRFYGAQSSAIPAWMMDPMHPENLRRFR